MKAEIIDQAIKSRKVIAAIGGETGWYHGTWLWVLRGLIDRLMGGVGTLDISIKEINTDLCELQQLATFRPRGLTGMAYWYCLLPLHNYIFNGMLKKVARLSENV